MCTEVCERVENDTLELGPDYFIADDKAHHRGATGAKSPFEVSGPSDRESCWSERLHD